MKLKPITEAQFQRQVMDYAKLRGWKCAHFRPAQTTKGWRTAVAGDGVGFVDLVLVRDRVLFVELKRSRSSKLRPEQAAWQIWLNVAGAEHYLWTPESWDEIARILR